MKGFGAPVLYQDRWIECTDVALIIRGYYFPFGLKKTIPYDRIRGLREFTIGKASGQWRIWGSGDLTHWFNLDPDRTRKTRALELDLGKFMLPVITPDDVAQVRKIIEERSPAATAGTAPRY